MLHCVESCRLLPDNLDRLGFGVLRGEDSLPHARTNISITHPAHFCRTNIHLPFLSLLVSLSGTQSGTPLEFITSLPVPLLKYIRSRCPLVPDTLDSLPWGSQTRSRAWALLRPVPRDPPPPQPRLQRWLWPQGPGSTGCQRLEMWRPRSPPGPSIPGFPRCDRSSGR